MAETNALFANISGLLATVTVKETIQTIRAMGLTCTRTAYGEYRINYPGSAEASAYYTEDAGDAIGTAKAMMAEAGKNG